MARAGTPEAQVEARIAELEKKTAAELKAVTEKADKAATALQEAETKAQTAERERDEASARDALASYVEERAKDFPELSAYEPGHIALAIDGYARTFKAEDAKRRGVKFEDGAVPDIDTAVRGVEKALAAAEKQRQDRKAALRAKYAGAATVETPAADQKADQAKVAEQAKADAAKATVGADDDSTDDDESKVIRNTIRVGTRARKAITNRASSQSSSTKPQSREQRLAALAARLDAGG